MAFVKIKLLQIIIKLKILNYLIKQRYSKEYIEIVYSLFMSFGFRIQKENLSGKDKIDQIKISFFSQTFEHVKILDPTSPISTVQKAEPIQQNSQSKLFSSLEEQIISSNTT